jgi:dihydropyrimidine dehydrogenase (NAD+) subunit PreT
VRSLELTKLMSTRGGSLVPQEGSEFSLVTDLIVLSIGQGTHTDFLSEPGGKTAKVQLERGRVLIDRVTGQTSNPKFFAGGDCTNGGREVVDAVADGKRAGIGIAAWLEGKHVQA